MWEATTPTPGRPLLATGPRATAIVGADGDLSVRLDTRGAPIDWGGVYGSGVRLTGPWTITVVVDGRAYSLAETLTALTARRSSITSEHRAGRVTVRQEVAAVELGAPVPTIGRRLVLATDDGGPVPVRVETTFSPYLAPVLVEGIKPYEYRAETRPDHLRVAAHGFGLALASDPLPSHLAADRASWLGGHRTGELREMMLDYDLDVAAGSSPSIAWLLGGGFERDLDRMAGELAAGFGHAERWTATAATAHATWLAGTPTLELPGLPEIERGYALARGALRQLYHVAEPELTGLVAGFPWYAAIWGRDLGWMLPAVTWLGDRDWAERSVRCLLRYQAKAHLPILGASDGELPMQLGGGPIFLYGTSDTTLYYPAILLRLLNLGAAPALLDEFAPALDRIEGWIDGKTDPASGLLLNGGEVAEIRTATADAGRVHFGFDAVDTTIWDSTDRRDHAVDIQALGVEALSALGRLRELQGRAGAAATLRSRSARLADAIAQRYRWPEEGYLVDSLRKDGTPVTKLRPNALRAVSVGAVSGPAARALVARATRDDLATAWGLRTLSAADPTYDPYAYHDGRVWPIATAWAADAALASGATETGLLLLALQGRRLVADGGYGSECYRGDVPEPYDACFLLGFSVAPFLTILFERLWGIQPDLTVGAIRVEPTLPAEAGPARLRHLALGSGTLDLALDAGRLTAVWDGTAPLTLASGDARVALVRGVPRTLDATPPK